MSIKVNEKMLPSWFVQFRNPSKILVRNIYIIITVFKNHFCSYNFYLFRNSVKGSFSPLLPYLKDRPKIPLGNERRLTGNIGFTHDISKRYRNRIHEDVDKTPNSYVNFVLKGIFTLFWGSQLYEEGN